MATLKPLVRLQRNPPAKKTGTEAHSPTKDQPIKLAVRLRDGVNEALRSLIRYRGDLSTMALEALATEELARLPLVSSTERMVRDTTISMPRALHKKLKGIAEDRGTSMNILVNTGLAHWLAKKDLLRLR